MFDDLMYDPNTGHFWWTKPSTKTRARSMTEPAGSLDRKGYRRITYNGRRYQAHRLAWFMMCGQWPTHQIDHLNGVKDDNRFLNLRQATASQNKVNSPRPATNTSGYKGVTFYRNLFKWGAGIKRDGVQQHLGLYDTPEEAHAAYSEAALGRDGVFYNPG